MEIEYAKDPQWANRSQTLVNLTVRFKEIPEDLPFTANPNDTASHGRELYARAIAGEFGVIADFSMPAPTVEYISSAVKEERNKRLAATDWTQLPDIPEATKTKWEPYRQALRDMPQDPSFPWYSLVVSESELGYIVDATLAVFPEEPTN